MKVIPVAIRGTEKSPFHDDAGMSETLPDPRIRPILPDPSRVYPESERILPDAITLPV